MRDLPSGTVTFLFTDVEGSTRLLHELGPEAYAEALAEHRRLLREAFAVHGGVEVDTQGDAFFVAFPTAPGALRAAEQATAALAGGPIRVRVGVHTGTPHLADEGYVGEDVHRAARIAAAGHGGQVLVSAATAALLSTAALRDLGKHRLKDLSAPELIFQLGNGDFPPLKSLHQTNLPVPATPFVGREHELAELRALFAREDVRLLTLTGPGGTGKTRLALQTAAEAADAFAGGVWWVPLAPLRDSALVVAEAATALGAKDGLADHVGDRSVLLFFDNFEHVVEAAGQLMPLLADCPNLRILVTSREVLRLPGEQAYPVPPLEPDEGKELFVARARGANPAFEPSAAVDELCGRLENLPLALELAAARVRMLSPEQLLDRLTGRLDLLKAGRGVDPRQQTLRATIEWSHELLDAEEQQLFARLAVFQGGCTLEAAEQVCHADLDVLQSLVDKSLVRVRDGDRFWMLETIREYAVERLDASSEADESRRRHAQYFVKLGEDAEPHLRKGSSEWLDRLEREHDNLRAALDRFELARDSESALRLAASAWRFWSLRGHLAEGRRRLESALAADPRPTLARATALNGASDLAQDTGDAATSRLRAEESLALHRALGHRWGTGEALLLLGLAMAIEDDWSDAVPLFVESAQLFRELGDEHMELEVTRRLAWAYENLGDRDRARVLHEENVRRARAIRDEFVEARSLGTLAQYMLDDGDAVGAVPMLVDAHRIHRRRRDLPDRYSDALIVCRFARALALQGRPATAAMLLSCSEGLFEEIGVSVEGWVVEMNDVTLTVIRRHIDEPELASAWESGRSLSLDDAVERALGSLEPAQDAARDEFAS